MIATGFAHAQLFGRPQHRSDCEDGPRPCPYVSCRHHLYLEVNPVTGALKINFPDTDPAKLAESCSLDVARRGGLTLKEVGDILNLTRERIRQLEVNAERALGVSVRKLFGE